MNIFIPLRRFSAFAFFGLFATSALATAKLQGKVGGFTSLDRDGWVDAAIVLPTLSEEQILSFDFGALLSPDEDMKAGPISTEVPGNVFVPTQKERYGILPVTLAKEHFTLFLEPTARQELFVMAMRAPFSDLVKKSRDKAPDSEILKLLSFGQLGYHTERDWSRVPNVDLSLNRDRPRSTKLSWTRPAANARELDVVIGLEATPAGRWMISDLNTQPQTSLDVKATSFSGHAKLMLSRTTFKADGEKLQDMRAWFPDYTRGSQVRASASPAALAQVKWIGASLLTWNPGKKSGWVTVFQDEGSALRTRPNVDASQIFFPDFSGLYNLLRPRVSSGWVRVEEGRIVVDLKGVTPQTSFSFVFLGGDLPDSPSLRGADELHVYNVTP